MNIRNLLVPVDLTPSSLLAGDCAVQFAKRFHAQLTLLHVIDEKVGRQDAEAALNRFSKMLSPDGPDDLEIRTRIRTGSIEDEIRGAIEDERASLVVVGTHHHGLIRRLLIGSVTEDMLRTIPVPLLTVTNDAQPGPLTRILFATDLTESSREGFRFTLELARSFGATLIVHHCIEPIPVSYGGSNPVIDDPTDRKLLIERAHRKLSELESEGVREQVTVVSKVSEGVASEKLLEASEELGSALIVLTIHHKSLLERALLGSTAERVVREAHVPVLSLPVNDESNWIAAETYPRDAISWNPYCSENG